MKIERLLKVVFIVLILGFYACQKDSLDRSPEEPSSLDVKIQVLNKSFNLPVGDTKSAYMETSSIVWDSAHMVVSSIKLEAEMKGFSQHDSIEISYKWTGPQLTNLFLPLLLLGILYFNPDFTTKLKLL